MMRFIFRPITNPGDEVRIERDWIEETDTVTVTYARSATTAHIVEALNAYPGLKDFKVTLEPPRRDVLDETLAIPEDLSERARHAAEAILDLAEAEHSAYTRGCRTFYSPSQWQARGEHYGQGAELVVVHDGSALARYFSYDREDYEAIDRMNAVLEPLGVYAEQLTIWATGLYANDRHTKTRSILHKKENP